MPATPAQNVPAFGPLQGGMNTQRSFSGPTTIRPLSAPVPANQDAEASLGSFHVVLLAPASDARHALAAQLWEVGMLVTAFNSVAEAEGVLVGEHVHAVVLDARLGARMAGTLLQWLQASGKPHVKLVVLGEVEPALRGQLAAAGIISCEGIHAEPRRFARQFAASVGVRVAAW